MVCNIVRGFNFADKQCNLQELDSTKEQLTTTEKELKIKSENILNLIEEKNALQLEKLETEKKLKELEDSLNPDPLEKELNEKRPAVNILYTARKLTSRMDYLNVDVKDFIMPNDFYVQKLVMENNWRDIENYEDRIVAIYKWYKSNLYSYEYDDRLYGGNYPEMWAFPFETLGWREHEGKAVGDCEDAAFVQHSLYLAAGVPYYVIRSSCGNIPLGDGHCSNYIYSKSASDWFHLNSTFGQSKIPDKLTDFPTTADAYNKSDNMGIYKPWFSMNHRFAFSGGITGASKKEFNKRFIFV